MLLIQLSDAIGIIGKTWGNQNVKVQSLLQFTRHCCFIPQSNNFHEKIRCSSCECLWYHLEKIHRLVFYTCQTTFEQFCNSHCRNNWQNSHPIRSTTKNTLKIQLTFFSFTCRPMYTVEEGLQMSDTNLWITYKLSTSESNKHVLNQNIHFKKWLADVC